MQASFVTLGQIVKFTYDAMGILPKKRDEKTSLTTEDIKRIQKQLERLTDEEGALLDRFGELIQTLHDELSKTIQNKKIRSAIGECFFDLFEVYNNIIRNDGTCLSPQESLRWLATAHAVPRLVLSTQKHIVRFNIAADRLIHPQDVDWYLPEISGDSITWPLQKGIEWVYLNCNTSPTKFHCGEKTHFQIDAELRQNFENASNWRKGKNLPSWSALHWNFSKSIDRLIVEGGASPTISSDQKEGMLYILFFARLSTYITKQVHDTYGKEPLVKLISLFKKQRDFLTKDMNVLKNNIANEIKENKTPQENHDEAWFVLSNQCWFNFSNHLLHCAKKIEQLITISDGYSISNSDILHLCEQYGEYTVHFILDSLNSAKAVNFPPFFAEAISNGFDLIKSSTTTLQEIDTYEENIRSKDLLFCLEWLVHWNRALLYYRNEEDIEAFKHITNAFKLAQYSAGKNQYQIVNQYIELSAKNNSWKNFKKGVSWAIYLDISVRWLRKDEPTEQKLRSVFNLMKNKKMRYPV